jgi:hypothetical protein
MFVQLHAKWKDNMHAKLMPLVIDLLDGKITMPIATQRLRGGRKAHSHHRGTLWHWSIDRAINPLRKSFRLDKRPYNVDRGCYNSSRTDT